MTSLELAFDEAGQTGSDLLNQDQPILVTAAVHCTHEEAADLIAPHVAQVAADVQFKRLHRSSAGRSAVLAILSDQFIRDRTKASSAHKRCLLYAFVVDVLIDPILKDRGLDIWQRGLNIMLRELLRSQIPRYVGIESEEEWLTRFSRMCRQPSLNSIESFCSATRRIRRRVPDATIVHILDIALLARDIIPDVVADRRPYPLDPAISNFVALTNLWREELESPFVISYDRSNVLERSQDALLALCDQSKPSTDVGHGDRVLKLPLPVERLVFVDSSAHAGVQLADIVASAIAYWSKNRLLEQPSSSFIDALEPLCKPLVAHEIWPRPDLGLDELDAPQGGGPHPDDALRRFLES